MQTSLKNYVVVPEQSAPQPQRFTSYYNRPTALIPRPNSRSHVDLIAPTQTYYQPPVEQRNYVYVRADNNVPNLNLKDSRQSILTSMTMTPKLNTDRRVQFPEHLHQTTEPNLRLNLSEAQNTPKKAYGTDRTTAPSQNFEDSRVRLLRKTEVYSTSYEDFLVHENGQLRE